MMHSVHQCFSGRSLLFSSPSSALAPGFCVAGLCFLFVFFLEGGMGASSGRSYYFFGLTAFLVPRRAPFPFAAANLFFGTVGPFVLVAGGARSLFRSGQWILFGHAILFCDGMNFAFYIPM
jgi:hypothetical protein